MLSLISLPKSSKQLTLTFSLSSSVLEVYQEVEELVLAPAFPAFAAEETVAVVDVSAEASAPAEEMTVVEAVSVVVEGKEEDIAASEVILAVVAVAVVDIAVSAVMDAEVSVVDIAV